MVNSTTGSGWTTGARQPLKPAANMNSRHKPSVRELPAHERCSSNFGRLVLTQHLNTAYQSRLGLKMDWPFSIAVSIYFLNSDDSGSKSTEPDEEQKRNNRRETALWSDQER